MKMAVLVPRGPRRTAAHSRNGSGAYSRAGEGAARLKTSRHTTRSPASPSAASSRNAGEALRTARAPYMAQVAMKGTSVKLGQNVRRQALLDELPVGRFAPSDQLDERGVEKSGKERRDQCREHQYDTHVAQRVEARPIAQQEVDRSRADQRLAAIAREPAEDHRNRHPALQLSGQMRGKSGDDEDPPDARRTDEKRGEQDRVGRPQRRDRVRLEREGEADLGAEVIAKRHQHRGWNDSPLQDCAAAFTAQSDLRFVRHRLLLSTGPYHGAGPACVNGPNSYAVNRT